MTKSHSNNKLKPSSSSITKKTRLQESLPYAELSEFDDLLTQVLLDGLYLGFTTHKFNETLLPLSAITETLVDTTESIETSKQIEKQQVETQAQTQNTDNSLFNNVSLVESMALVIIFLIRKYISRSKDVEGAAGHLLELFMKPELVYRCSSDPDEDERILLGKAKKTFEYFGNVFKDFNPRKQVLFKDHAKRYLSMYIPNAGYEICRTFRYKTDKVEARIIATRDYDVGDEIRACSGVIAELTKEEEDALKNRDFSVMFSTKKNCMCLFLGPARFVNHDCKPNCKFININHNLVAFKVIQPIRMGQEITCFYSDNYFGTDNQDCLCETCESYCRNGHKKDSQEQEQYQQYQDSLDESCSSTTVKIIGNTSVRSSSARTANFNYFDNYHKAKKTLVKEDQGPTCFICEEPHKDMDFNCVSNTYLDPCYRCIRHKLVFGLDWPLRKIPNMEVTDDDLKSVYLTIMLYKREWEAYKIRGLVNWRNKGLISAQEAVMKFSPMILAFNNYMDHHQLKMDQEIPEELFEPEPLPVSIIDMSSILKVVYVFPEDDPELYWPAIRVPESDYDDSMPKVDSENSVLVRYFEDFTYSTVKESEIKEFDESILPFSLLSMDGARVKKEFYRCKTFLDSKQVNIQMKWKSWRVMDSAKIQYEKKIKEDKARKAHEAELRLLHGLKNNVKGKGKKRVSLSQPSFTCNSNFRKSTSKLRNAQKRVCYTEEVEQEEGEASISDSRPRKRRKSEPNIPNNKPRAVCARVAEPEPVISVRGRGSEPVRGHGRGRGLVQNNNRKTISFKDASTTMDTNVFEPEFSKKDVELNQSIVKSPLSSSKKARLSNVSMSTVYADEENLIGSIGMEENMNDSQSKKAWKSLFLPTLPLQDSKIVNRRHTRSKSF